MIRLQDKRFLTLVILLYFALNYNPHFFFRIDLPVGWVFAFALTILLLAISRMHYKDEFAAKTGLTLSGRSALWYLLFAAALLPAMYLFFENIAWQHDLYYVQALVYPFSLLSQWFPPLSKLYLLNFHLYHFFQTFNDEIVIGAIALFTIEKMFPKVNGLVISVLVALVFSLMHGLYFFLTPLQRGFLALPVLLSLFFAGFIRNYLIVATRRIYLSWILHFSWNALLFSGYFYSFAQDKFIASEVERLNIVMGDWRTVSTLFGASLLVLVLVNRKTIRTKLFSAERGEAAS